MKKTKKNEVVKPETVEVEELEEIQENWEIVDDPENEVPEKKKKVNPLVILGVVGGLALSIFGISKALDYSSDQGYNEGWDYEDDSDDEDKEDDTDSEDSSEDSDE